MRQALLLIGILAAFLVGSVFGPAAHAVAFVDMNFDGVTGLENTGIAGDGVLMNGASIDATAGVGGSGALRLDGSNDDDADGGSGLDLPDLGALGVFSGIGDFTVSFQFAITDTTNAPQALFAADGSQWLEDNGIEWPGEGDESQVGSLNIRYEPEIDEIVADHWFIDGAGVAGGNYGDGNFHNLVAFYSAADQELLLTVDDVEAEFLIPGVDEEGIGLPRDTANDITRLGDANNPDDDGGEVPWNSGCACLFDNLLIDGPSPPPVKLVVDGTSGDFSLEVIAGEATTFDTLTIESDNGTLNGGSFTGLAGTGGDFADWTIDPADEFAVSESGTAATVDNTDGPYALGSGVWTPFWDRDLRVEINDTGLGGVVAGLVEYIGDPLLFGDLTLDGAIDVLDYQEFQAGFGSDLEGLSFFDAYFQSDLNGDGVHNFDDWIEFIDAYDGFAGEGAFAAMVAGVPEPGTCALLLMGLVGLLTFGRRAPRVAAPLVVAMFISAGTATVEATTFVEYFFDNVDDGQMGLSDSSGNNRHGVKSIGAETVSGGMLNLGGDFEEGVIVPGAGALFDGLTSYTIEMTFNSIGNSFFDPPSGVILFGAANSAEPTLGDNQSFSLFVEPQEEEEGDIFGGSLVADHFFVGDARVDDAVLLDGVNNSVIVTYAAPDEAGDPEDPNPGTFYMNVRGEWVTIAEMAPRPAAALDDARIGGSLNEDFPFECEEGACFTSEFQGTVDHFAIRTDDMVEIPTLLRAEVDRETGDINLVGGEFAREINYYEVNSEGDALNPGYTGLGDQNVDEVIPAGSGSGSGPDGLNWDKANAATNQLVETFLIGSSEFDDERVESLFGAYAGTGEGDEDLEIFAVTLDREVIELDISYFNDYLGFIIGDMNGDGEVNFGDLTPFALGLTDIPAYDAAFPELASTRVARGDVNEDTAFNFGDLTPFVDLLTSGGAASGQAVPEPSSLMLTLMALAAVGSIIGRRRS